jgi:hypothetical protein
MSRVGFFGKRGVHARRILTRLGHPDRGDGRSGGNRHEPLQPPSPPQRFGVVAGGAVRANVASNC